MLRLLHTADWHLGQTLQGWSREREHRATLRELVEVAAAREVDAVILAGDVFDTLAPNAEALALFYETLKALRAARPLAPIVVVAGNHDPAGRLEAPDALFRLLDVRVVGTIARVAGALDIDRHLVALPGGAHVVAVPFPRLADLPPVPREAEGSAIVHGVRALHQAFDQAARARIGDAPLIYTGHLHVAGGLESEGAERRILVGGEHAVPPDVFPADAAYVALGHLHRPQAVGRETIRYSGSLFPLSKTEIGYKHGVTLVTVDGQGRATLEHVPLARPTAWHALPDGGGGLGMAELAAAFAALPLDADMAEDARPFVSLTLKREGAATGLKADVDQVAAQFPLRLVSFALERVEAAAAPALEAQPETRLVERDPTDLFRAAYERLHKAPPEERHERLFAQALAVGEG